MSVWDRMDAEQALRERRWAASLDRRDEVVREVNARRRDDWVMTGEGYASDRGRALHGAKREAGLEADMAASIARLRASSVYRSAA